MPQLFRSGPYSIYFWSNEGQPLEAVHVHIAQRPSANATKVWISSEGRACLCNNNSHIPDKVLHSIMRLIEARSSSIIQKWVNIFGEARYYC